MIEQSPLYYQTVNTTQNAPGGFRKGKTHKLHGRDQYGIHLSINTLTEENICPSYTVIDMRRELLNHKTHSDIVCQTVKHLLRHMITTMPEEYGPNCKIKS